ncbi:pancreatic secretory granule membrane major glycoprotein GP2-like [Rhinophrynus dorsalis]
MDGVTTLGTGCSSIECKNEGVCHMVRGKATCTCKPGFSGLYCQDASVKLDCDDDHMSIQVLRSVTDDLDINPSSLHMSSPQCKMQVITDQFVSIILTPENHTFCGTHVQVNGSHLIYSNELTTQMSLKNRSASEGLISRSPDFRIRFICVYPYDRIVSLPFPLITSSSFVTFVVKEGIFNVTMTLHPTAEFLEPYVSTQAIPVSQRLYVQLKIHGHGPQSFFTLKVEECWATPTANHSNKIRYPIISDRDGDDSTVAMISLENNLLSRFSMQMFHFVSYPEVYLHCRIWLCQPNETFSCSKPERRIQRKKRDIGDPYKKVISCGPIRLARTTVSSFGNPNSGISPLVLPGSFAAGAILALFCLVALARVLKRMGYSKRVPVTITS